MNFKYICAIGAGLLAIGGLSISQASAVPSVDIPDTQQTASSSYTTQAAAISKPLPVGSNSAGGQQVAEQQIDLHPYTYFKGTKQFLGADGSQTQLAPMTPVELRVYRGSDLIETITGGVRANRTLYLDRDLDLGQWNQGNAVPGTILSLQAVDRVTSAQLGTTNVVLPQPHIGEIQPQILASPWGNVPWGKVLYVDKIRIDNVPAGAEVEVKVDSPNIVGQSAWLHRVDASWQIEGSVTLLFNPAGTGYSGTITVTVRGTTASRTEPFTASA